MTPSSYNVLLPFGTYVPMFQIIHDSIRTKIQIRSTICNTTCNFPEVGLTSMYEIFALMIVKSIKETLISFNFCF